MPVPGFPYPYLIDCGEDDEPEYDFNAADLYDDFEPLEDYDAE